jgi:L-iditol 2-dehydrogenase
VALHAFDLAHVRPGAGAGVFGCGPLGLLLVQLLHMAGASPIVATDTLPHRVAAAEALGATNARLAGTGTDEDGLDVAFEVAGDDGAVDEAIASLRPTGRLVLVGIPDDDRTSFHASLARRKGLTLLLSRRMTASDLPRALRLAAEGRVVLGPLVSERFSLDEWPEAFASLRERRGLKVVVEP